MTSDPSEVLKLRPRPRLLLVDDETGNIQVLYRIFRESCEVFFASNAEEALAFCRKDPPDLVLSDIVMPGMDGLALCRALKQDPETRDLPVIFVTAQQTPQEEGEALASGAVDFISKPVNPVVVRARVQTHLTLKAQADLLRSIDFLDGLTGVANRRRFDEVLDAEWRRSRRQRHSVALAMIDLDHFKALNDTCGHQAGDLCLQAVARALAERVRRSHDLVARYVGEEFACILPDTDLEGARELAGELRQAVHALGLPHPTNPSGRVTISLGVASCVPSGDEGPELLVSMADALLYEAKAHGRDRVEG